MCARLATDARAGRDGVAVADLGVQLNHPDLTSRTLGAPHFNFFDHTTNGNPAIATGPTSGSWAHGTEVAGLIAAEGNNRAGMVGVAPEAQLASWVIFCHQRHAGWRGRVDGHVSVQFQCGQHPKS